MILDASAVVAVIFEEAECDAFLEAIITVDERAISAVNYVEAGIRVDRSGNPTQSGLLDAFCNRLSIEIAPVTAEQARIARDACRRFGKGNHPARLDPGDCFAYALATARGEPLLFKGDDFALTDVRPAL